MDFNCSIPNCTDEVFLECDCPEKLKFCLAHIEDLMSHSGVKKCSQKNVNDVYLMKLTTYNQNALDGFESEILSLSGEIKDEIDSCLNENSNYIQKKKSEVKELIYTKQKNNAIDLVNEVGKLKCAQREKKYLVSSLRKLLIMDQSNMQIDFDAESFENNYKEVSKKLEDALEKIKDFETKLSISNDLNQNLVKEKTILEDKCSKLCKELCELQPTLYASEKLDDEEEKNSLQLEEFKSELKIGNFSSMRDEDKKNSLVELNFQDFKKSFVDENKKIMELHLTNDNNHIFICKVKADCIE